MADGMRIEYVALSELHRHPRNPKAHDLGAIHTSVNRFGYVSPVMVDERTGYLVAGHGRLDTLAQMQREGKEPPARIEARGGDWYVPVVRGVTFNSDSEVEAYLVADNRLTELGGWDEPELAALLQSLADEDVKLLEATGYDADDLQALLDELTPPIPAEDAGAQVDRAAELQAQWQTERGQLWVIPSKSAKGEHRLLCGDSTNAEDVARVMAGERAALFSTDPPYGVDFSGQKFNPRAKDWDGIEGDQRQGDDLELWLRGCLDVWLPHVCEDAGFYLWCAPMAEGMAVYRAVLSVGLHVQSQIVWVKNVLVLGQADYQWRHEVCWYAFFKGKHHRWLGERDKTTVWEIDKLANQAYMHPMQKPTELYAIPMRHHTTRGELCAEPFAGSGSQFVAGEQEGRRVAGLELEPKYCAVILQRMADMGLEPRLADGP